VSRDYLHRDQAEQCVKLFVLHFVTPSPLSLNYMHQFNLAWYMIQPICAESSVKHDQQTNQPISTVHSTDIELIIEKSKHGHNLIFMWMLAICFECNSSIYGTHSTKIIKMKKCSERRKHCALAVVRQSQKFSPRRGPPS